MKKAENTKPTKKRGKKTISSREELGKNMQRIRSQKGRTQKYMADQLNIEGNTYEYYEKGYILPSILNLISIAKALNVNVEEFLYI